MSPRPGRAGKHSSIAHAWGTWPHSASRNQRIGGKKQTNKNPSREPFPENISVCHLIWESSKARIVLSWALECEHSGYSWRNSVTFVTWHLKHWYYFLGILEVRTNLCVRRMTVKELEAKECPQTEPDYNEVFSIEIPGCSAQISWEQWGYHLFLSLMLCQKTGQLELNTRIDRSGIFSF